MIYKSSLPTILFFSSDPSKTVFFKKTLKNLFYLIEAKDESEALEYISMSSIDIFIIDFRSLSEPIINFCDHVRALLKGKKTPILLVTHLIKKDFVTMALKSGISDFLYEPLDQDEILEKIELCKHSNCLSKKISSISFKISTSPLIPKNTNTFLHRMLLNNQSLEKIAKAKKIDMPLSLLIIQLDQFESLHQRIGELCCEEVICFLDFFLSKHLRKFDTLIAQGGGRYIIMLPKTSSSAGKIIAEELRKEISQTPISTKKEEIIVTVSIGVVSFDKKLNDAAEAYELFNHSLNLANQCLANALKKGNTTISENHLKRGLP